MPDDCLQFCAGLCNWPKGTAAVPMPTQPAFGQILRPGHQCGIIACRTSSCGVVSLRLAMCRLYALADRPSCDSREQRRSSPTSLSLRRPANALASTPACRSRGITITTPHYGYTSSAMRNQSSGGRPRAPRVNRQLSASEFRASRAPARTISRISSFVILKVRKRSSFSTM